MKKYLITGLLVWIPLAIPLWVLASNILGQRLLRVWERILGRIPVVKSIYYGVKQVSDTLFTPGGQAFRKALLVQYPRPGAWIIAFQTGQPGGDVVNHLKGDYVSVYVPTTPNPTSGFFLMLPRQDVIELDMSVDEALKYVVSMGVVSPGNGRKEKKRGGRRGGWGPAGRRVPPTPVSAGGDLPGTLNAGTLHTEKLLCTAVYGRTTCRRRC